MITDEKFMEELTRKYPDEDWSKVPDPENIPDIYYVTGEGHYVYTNDAKTTGVNPAEYKGERKIWTGFFTTEEFATEGEALIQLEKCKTWAGVIADSLKICVSKPGKAIWKHFDKEMRDLILAGEKVFPIRLP